MTAAERKLARRISAEEARRAIYLDFEGFEDREPCLVGFLVDGEFSQIVTDGRLAWAAEAKNLAQRPFDEVVRDLLKRAEDERRRLAGFTEHEIGVASRFGGTDLSPVYADVHKIVKRRLKALPNGQRPESWSQEALEVHCQIERPGHLRSGNATGRLRHVIDQLGVRGEYAELTGVAKAKWTKLLRYNELDVKHLPLLLEGTRGFDGLLRAEG